VISATKVNNLIRSFEDLDIIRNFRLGTKREIVMTEGRYSAGEIKRNCNIILSSITIFIYISCVILPMQIFNYY